MNVQLILKGAAMGIAEAIPGVSGGTIAFITGIYQELIETIKSFHPGNLKLVFSHPKSFWNRINGPFLGWLLCGMAIGLLLGIFVISYLLEHYQALLWSVFFGLVLASAYYLGKGVKWSWQAILGALIGAVLSYMITTLVPAEGSEHPLYLLVAGTVAVSALMLPGISGSFILLLLGLYATVINELKEFLSSLDPASLKIIGIFSAGLLIGLFSFSRILSYLFRRYEMITMGTMIGVLIGSLNKLWPWKKITAALSKTNDTIVQLDTIQYPNPDEYKILTEVNLSPFEFAHYEDPMITQVIICFLAGLLSVFLLSRFDAKMDSKE